MIPVLLQNLIKRNKGKFKAIPTSKEEAKRHGDKFLTVVLCFIAVMVLVGLILK
jgi:hypothetical protein